MNEDITAPDWDVIHSWWVPDFGGKYDAIPGKVNKTWFQAPAGTYVARCYEFCGIQHAAMKAKVDVVPRAQYDAFIAKRASPAGKLDLGREEWTGVCQSCHRLDHKYIGPALGGNPLLGDKKGLDDAAAQRAGTDAFGRQGLERRADRRARRVHEAVREGGRLMAVNVESARPYRADWRTGRVALVADDGRPQADRDPLHRHVARSSSRRAACSRCSSARSSRRPTSTC